MGQIQHDRPHGLLNGGMKQRIRLGGVLMMAALISGHLDGAWLVAIRRWALASWFMLTLGLVLGMIIHLPGGSPAVILHGTGLHDA